MAIQTGVNCSKLVGYALVNNPAGTNVSKVVGYALVFNMNTNAPLWTAFTFAGGFKTIPYSQGWDLFPACPDVTYSVVAGALPTGLTVNSPGGTLGNITGTPTVAGTFTFTLRASNSLGHADRAFSITISTLSNAQNMAY